MKLEINNLCKKYKDFSLDDVSFKLDDNLIMGFIGPNGAGKSTTIKLIMNLIKKDSGQIKVFGLDHLKDEQAIKQRIGFVFDENHFHESLTIQEMKDIIRVFYLQWDEDLFHQYIKEFRLPLKKKLKDLSKGMRMKFSLAVALSHDADLLIMDEPTSGLDPVVRSELLERLKLYVQNSDKSVFFSTHITSDLERVADQITLMNKGKVVFSKSKNEVMAGHYIVRGDINNVEGIKDHTLIGLKKDRNNFVALVEKKHGIESQLRNWGLIEKPTLEDIMLFYVEEGLTCSI